MSFAEGERPTYEQARAALDTQIKHLGYDRMTPEAPSGLGAFFKQAAYEREYADFLTYRSKLTPRLGAMKINAAEYESTLPRSTSACTS